MSKSAASSELVVVRSDGLNVLTILSHHRIEADSIFCAPGFFRMLVAFGFCSVAGAAAFRGRWLAGS